MSTNHNGVTLYTAVDDEMYDELSELIGQKVVYINFWEDSLADALVETEADPATQNSFDLDVYLEDGIYFELYGTSFFPDVDSEPLEGIDQVNQHMNELGKQGTWLTEIAVDENDELILVLSDQAQQKLYLAVGGWLLEEWDELPEA